MATSENERGRTAVLVPEEPAQTSVAVHRASVVLVVTVWVSVTLFGAYILAHSRGP